MRDENSSDLVGQLLQDFRFSGVAYGRCEMRRPWSISFSADGTARLHLVVEGEAWLRAGEGAWEALEQGDVVLLIRGPGHVLADHPDRPSIPIEELDGREVADKVFQVEVPGSGPRSIMTCCSVAYDGPALKSLVAHMPDRILIRAEDKQAGDPLLAMLLDAMAAEVSDNRPGGATMLSRLADLAIARIIRSWAETANAGRSGWLAAVHDRRLGKVIAAMHRRPGEAWRADTLAQEAGMSKSAFYQRFTETLGQTPSRYLASIRMSAAIDLLRSGQSNVAAAAMTFGYESEASFRRAFKRVVGQPPGQMRVRDKFGTSATSSGR